MYSAKDILESKPHSEKNVEEICFQYKNLVKKIARNFFLQFGDEEDLVQEGMIGLYKAFSTYTSSKGAFSTYATLCVKSQIITTIRKEYSKGRFNLNGGISLENNNLSDVIPSNSNEFERIAETDFQNERLAKLKKVLSKNEVKVLDLYLEGLSYSEMAQILLTNTKSIENSIKRIKEKVREEQWDT